MKSCSEAVLSHLFMNKTHTYVQWCLWTQGFDLYSTMNACTHAFMCSIHTANTNVLSAAGFQFWTHTIFLHVQLQYTQANIATDMPGCLLESNDCLSTHKQQTCICTLALWFMQQSSDCLSTHKQQSCSHTEVLWFMLQSHSCLDIHKCSQRGAPTRASD